MSELVRSVVSVAQGGTAHQATVESLRRFRYQIFRNDEASAVYPLTASACSSRENVVKVTLYDAWLAIQKVAREFELTALRQRVL